MLIGICGASHVGKRTLAALLREQSHVPSFDSVAEVLRGTSHAGSTGSCGGAPFGAGECWRAGAHATVVFERVTCGELDALLGRPYFLLVHVSAPLAVRYARASRLFRYLSVGTYSARHDGGRAAAPRWSDNGLGAVHEGVVSHEELVRRSHVRVENCGSVEELRGLVREMRLLDPGRLRPCWDEYFLRLANLAARRTNCMKRRVGCVVMRENRVVSTGYNGTPAKLRNCFEGGCPRCNDGGTGTGSNLDLCRCMHAEENALLEAGREKCQDATLYTNLFPCMLCTRKIVQAGICRVVYTELYGSEEPAADLMRSAGLVVDRFGVGERPGLSPSPAVVAPVVQPRDQWDGRTAR